MRTLMFERVADGVVCDGLEANLMFEVHADLYSTVIKICYWPFQLRCVGYDSEMKIHTMLVEDYDGR